MTQNGYTPRLKELYERELRPQLKEELSLESIMQVPHVEIDALFGDDDGLLIATAERIAAALETAELIGRSERAILAAQARGEALHGLTNYGEHLAALDRGEASALAFRVDD